MCVRLGEHNSVQRAQEHVATGRKSALRGDGAGALVATQRYWPYGTVRAGGVAVTDKLYTGQQEEPEDGALGL